MRSPDEIQVFNAANQLARKRGMFAIDRGDHFRLYRKTPTRPVLIGSRSDVVAFRSLVSRCAQVA